MVRGTNWRVYERAEREELSLFLEIAKEVVWRQREPRGWKKRKEREGAGRPPYDWRGVVVLLLLKVFYRWVFRELASFVKGFPELGEKLELKKAPSRATLQRAMGKLDGAWLRGLNDEVVAELKKRGST